MSRSLSFGPGFDQTCEVCQKKPCNCGDHKKMPKEKMLEKIKKVVKEGRLAQEAYAPWTSEHGSSEKHIVRDPYASAPQRLCGSLQGDIVNKRNQVTCGGCIRAVTRLFKEHVKRLESEGRLSSTCRGCEEFYRHYAEQWLPGDHGPFAPSHKASERCKSGKRAHCTCDTCF